MMRCILLCLVLSLGVQLLAQDSLPQRKRFRPERVRILVGGNYSYISPFVKQHDIFRGEFRQHEDSAAVWTDRDNTYNLNKYIPVRNFQMTLQGNFWKGLYFGFHYQFYTLKQYKQDPVGGNLLSKTNANFFLVATSFGYAFDLLKDKNLQIMPSLRLGSYSADDYYDAKGKKFYLGLDCKIRYFIKNKFGLTLGADYDFLRYKAESYSELFQRPAYKKVTFNNVHFSAGFAYNIHIRLAEK